MAVEQLVDEVFEAADLAASRTAPERGREEPRGRDPGALSLLVFAGQAGGSPERFRSTVQLSALKAP